MIWLLTIDGRDGLNFSLCSLAMLCNHEASFATLLGLLLVVLMFIELLRCQSAVVVIGLSLETSY